MTAGRSLQLYFVDGKPDGMLTAEVFGWTGHVLKFARSQTSAAMKRPEATNTGVYILLGPINGVDTAYIGESETVKTRILDHISKKEWWEQAIVITSTGNGLHKAHVKFLESRLIKIAQSIGHTPLENNTAPTPPSLSEADISNMESFLETLNMVLPAIRVDMFMEKKRDDTRKFLTTESVSIPEFELHAKKAGITASALIDGSEFIVQKGSDSQISWVGKHLTNYQPLQAELIANGVIAPKGKIGSFSKGYAFSSPSAAAAVVLGRSANGRTEWKVKGTSKTYSEWEIENLKSDEHLT